MTEFKKLLDLHFLRAFSQEHAQEDLALMRKNFTITAEDKHQKEERRKIRQTQKAALLAKYARHIATDDINSVQ